MNKKLIIGLALVMLIVVGIGVGTMINSNDNMDENLNSANTNLNNENNIENNSSDDEEKISGDEKTLVVYFSMPETEAPNNMTTDEDNSAVVVDGKVLGNTQYVAMLIQEKTGADIYRIEPKEPYTTNHTDLVDQALKEQQDDARPEIKDSINNFDEYDTIFVGYPIWWSDLPQILYTFLESYDFEGKTVIPFSTHGGSGLASTVSTIKKKLSNSNVEDNAFTMSRNNMEQAPGKVEEWLKEIQ